MLISKYQSHQSLGTAQVSEPFVTLTSLRLTDRHFIELHTESKRIPGKPLPTVLCQTSR